MPVIPAQRVLLGLQPLSVNSTRSLLRSGLPAFGTTTAVQTPSSLWLETNLPTLAVYSLRVQAGIKLIKNAFYFEPLDSRRSLPSKSVVGGENDEINGLSGIEIYMQTLTVGLSERSYPIHIGAGVLAQAELLLPHLPHKQVVIVTNTTVAPLYLDALRLMLQAHGKETIPIILPDGEEYKNAETLGHIYDALLQNHCERKTPLIALGGGVIGDMTGYAAATYLRGVPFIQIPTTLLAQVDSSVGGKTGINHPLGKNMIGAFYQPQVVIADSATLNTLPDRELRAGIAEVIKYGLIRDAEFFVWLENNIHKLLARDVIALDYAIRRSCENKADVVAADEREGAAGIRATLNLGHTFGHAIENGMGYGVWLHGEAVAAGTILAAHLSACLGLLNQADVERITQIFQQAELPITAPNLGVEKYLQLMGLDKKVEGGKMSFVLLKSIGHAYINKNVPDELLRQVLVEGTVGV